MLDPDHTDRTQRQRPAEPLVLDVPATPEGVDAEVRRVLENKRGALDDYLVEFE